MACMRACFSTAGVRHAGDWEHRSGFLFPGAMTETWSCQQPSPSLKGTKASQLAQIVRFEARRRLDVVELVFCLVLNCWPPFIHL